MCESARIRRDFAAHERIVYEGHGAPDDQDGKREQKQQITGDINDGAMTVAESRAGVEEINPDMLVALQRPGRAEQDDDAEQVPFEFLGGDRTAAKQVTHGDVV